MRGRPLHRDFGTSLTTTRVAIALVVLSIGYYVAFAVPMAGPAILLAMPALFTLTGVRSSRAAIYIGLTAGLLTFSPQLWFFKAVFGWRGLPLWLIAAWPFAVVVWLLRLTRARFGNGWVLVVMTPVIWTGIEFFRSELYYFKFSWIIPGQVVAYMPGIWLDRLGVYGFGFAAAFVAALAIRSNRWTRLTGVVASCAIAILMYTAVAADKPSGGLTVAGVQLEFPNEPTVVSALDRMASDHPEADLWVLPEYTFDGDVPKSVRNVVRTHRKYLVAGTKHWLADGTFYDAAVVVGPDGRDVFWQAKSVPVQLMADGRPAVEWNLWDSPWGKLALAVCYDIGYTRPLDRYVRQGAVGLIVPTMDMVNWGEYERRMLHGRCAPIRSAEYGIPVFGVWSSGVSQLTDYNGRVTATGTYPGQGDVIVGSMNLHPGRVPPDRPLAWACTIVTGVWVVWLLALPRFRR